MIKNKIKFILLIAFALTILIFSKCNAETVNIDYKNINESSTLSIGNLYFNPIDFKNFSDKSGIFGLAGIVENKGNSAQNFIATAKFYDKNYNLIATLESNQFVPAYERNSYSNVGNISQIKSGYSANDILYYSLSVNINDIIQSTEAISNTTNQDNSRYDYTIEDYKIDIIVNEDNTFDVTETITANFNVSKHGIFRKIPLKNSVTRNDGTKSTNRAKV